MNAPAPATLRGQFGRAARRRKLVEIALGASWWLGSVGLAALALVVVDNLAPLPSALRLVAAPALAIAALVGLWRKVIAPLRASASPESAAQAFERAAGREDNLLINACQFEATALSPEERSLAAPALIQAQTVAAGLSLRGLLRLRALGLWLAAALVAVGAWLAYVHAYPERCVNALARFARPLADIPPLGAWAITTEPSGDSAVVEGSAFTLSVRVRALRDGVPPTAPLAIWREGADAIAVDALADGASGEKLALSRDNDGRWLAVVPAVRRGFALRVFCGDSCSSSLRVAVMPLPRLASSSFTVTPPAYTGLAALPAAGPPATLSVLPGSMVALTAEVAPEVDDLTWQVGGKRVVAAEDDGRWHAQATITAGGTYELTSGDVVLVRAALALEQDRPPRVELSGLGDNRLALPGEQIAVTIVASDDFGLRDLALSVRDSAGGEAWTAKTWSWIGPPGMPTATSSHALVLDPERFQPGHAYVVSAAGRDWSDGPAGVSRPAVVRIRAIADIAAVAEADAPAIAALKEAIARQGEAAGLSDNLAAQLVEALANQRLANHRDAIAAKQEQAKVAGSVARDAFAKAADASSANVLTSLVDGEMAVVARDLGALPARTAEQAPGTVATIRDRQRWIHGQLVALLGQAVGSKLAAKEKAAHGGPEQPMPTSSAVRDLAADLAEFIRAQERIVAKSRSLADPGAMDLGDERDRVLGALAREEAKQAKFLEEKLTDFSKLPQQDFADSSLASEFNAVFQEVSLAAKALYENKVELAVPHEQSGLELAKSLEHNLERWLAASPDHEKWKMEEPLAPAAVPVAELPRQLEDIVGDLLDKEDEMEEDVEDVSSSWLDSMDKGAGWDAMDGPIGNMSAKGVTGNRLPNKNEIGGRSGEGREGKSSGQMVEDSAVGKDGRETPTRLSPSPFESGSVKDTSTKAGGGATGGGKVSGGDAEGLRGPVPPPLLEKMQRLAGAQAKIRQEASAVALQLRQRRVPSGDLESAVVEMQAVEEAIARGDGGAIRARYSAAVDALADARRSAIGASGLSREALSLGGRERANQQQVDAARVPAGYEDMAARYFQALAETPVEEKP